MFDFNLKQVPLLMENKTLLAWFFRYLKRRLENFSIRSKETLDRGLFSKSEFFDQSSKIDAFLEKQIKCENQCNFLWLPVLLINAFRGWCKVYEFENYFRKSWTREIVETIFQLAFLVFLLKYVFAIHSTPTGSAEPNILVGDRTFAWRCNYRFSPIKHGDLIIFIDPTFKYDKKSKIKAFWQRHVGIAIPLLDLPEGPSFWVKRVIGLPGDKIEGRVINGKTVVYRNDKQLDEPYVNPYPLIYAQYELGLFDKSFGMPEFLTKKFVTKQIPYDQTLPFEGQNFYKVDSNKVLKDEFNRPILLRAGSPTRYGNNRKTVDEFGPFVVPEGKFWGMGDNRRGSYDSRGFGLVGFEFVVGRASRILWSLDSHENWWFMELFKNPIEFFTKKLRWSRFGRSLHPFEKVYNT